MASEELSIQDILEQYLTSLDGDKLFVLIWGPGRDDANYEKRTDILRELRRRFPRAHIHFNDDGELRKVTRDKFLTYSDEELCLAVAADIILALDTSQGGIDDVAKYAKYREVRKKLVILM